MTDNTMAKGKRKKRTNNKSKYSVNSEPDFKVNHVTIATTTLKFVTCCTDRFFVGFLLLDL
jgi:hypothetical protein